jgi:hypothetical protein
MLRLGLPLSLQPLGMFHREHSFFVAVVRRATSGTQSQSISDQEVFVLIFSIDKQLSHPFSEISDNPD